jgi:hypothetical protein
MVTFNASSTFSFYKVSKSCSNEYNGVQIRFPLLNLSLIGLNSMAKVKSLCPIKG